MADKEIIFDRLIVRDFGPIKHADIEIKKLNVFIGPTGSGKSTLAKLISILNSGRFNLSSNSKEDFLFELANYNLLGYENRKTRIEYIFFNGRYHWSYEHSGIQSDYPYANFSAQRLRVLISRERIPITRFKRITDEINSIRVDLIKNQPELNLIKKIRSDLSNIQATIDKSKRVVPLDSETNQGAVNSIRKFIDLAIGGTRSSDTLFIPAERIFFSVFANAINSLLATSNEDKLPFPGYLNRFASEYEFSFTDYEGSFYVEEMNLLFKYEEEDVYYVDGDKKSALLQHVASGIQSLYPALKTIDDSWEYRSMIVIEEPELNLFPEAQYNFVKFLIKYLNKPHGPNLVLTTHSPYVLTAIDNLILAKNVALEKPKHSKAIAEMIPQKFWLDFDFVNAYYFNPKPKRSNTNTELILNEQRRGIAGNVIDSVSEELNFSFEYLTSLRYS